MFFVLVPLMLVAAVSLAWLWWNGRAGRDPVASIDSFHRALEAMQPGERRIEPDREAARSN